MLKLIIRHFYKYANQKITLKNLKMRINLTFIIPMTTTTIIIIHECQSFGAHLFPVPSLVRFPFCQPGSPVFQRVLFGIFESTPVTKSSLRLNSRDHVHRPEIHLKPFADALFYRWFGTPTTPGTFHF